MDELVHLQVTDGTATVTLDSPANRNALSARLLRDLAAHLGTALAGPDVRVLVITHAGPAFCAGMDLREAGGAGAGDQAVALLPTVLETLWTAAVPVVARLAGAVRGGGIGIVAACDIVVATRAVSFAFPEVRLGVVPAVVSAPVLPRLRPRDAQELFLTGETVDGARAAEIGLVSRAVDDVAALDGEVARLVAMLRLGAPGALAATKALLRRGRPSLAADLAELAALSAAHFAGDEGQEGIRARAERRPPSWAPPS
jgi:methylglutaconyl-CoA hydratase